MPEIAHLSSLAGSPLLDSDGERLGKVDDVVARLDDGSATVIGLTARIGGREMFVPVDRVQQLGPHSVQTSTTKLTWPSSNAARARSCCGPTCSITA